MSEEGQQGCLKMKMIEYHDYKTLLGPCFISFSIPLLVPGVVLTVVGSYGNQSSFPTYGAWHVIGLVFLSLSLLLLISGILLKCFYRPVISAEIEQHLSPVSSKITGSKNLGYENEIYCSNHPKLNNKVSHHDLNEMHRVVSTHEIKTTNNTKDKSKQFFANGALNQDKKNRQKGRGQEDERTSSNATTIVTSSGTETGHPSPPSYEQIKAKNKRNMKPEPTEIPESNFTSSAVRTMQGQVKVTANIIAEAETTTSSVPRDMSSDGGNEQTSFLPEKKRKKKKRRKRHSNLSQQSHQSQQSAADTDGAVAETSARQELPELHVRPVLKHDGEEHHHHDLHVHFREANVTETIPQDISDKNIHES